MTEKTGVWGVWYGGASYTPALDFKDLEYFQDIEEAKEKLLSRYATGHWKEQVFNYADGRRDEARTPAVGEGCEMALFYSNPTDDSYPYPSVQLTLAFTEDDEAFVVENPC